MTKLVEQLLSPKSRANNANRDAYAAKAARAKRGETLVEVLAAILVSGLAILMLATVIAAATTTNTKSRDAMNTYYTKGNQIALSNADNGTGKVTFKFDNESMKLEDSTDGAASVKYDIYDESGTIVATYEKS